MALLNVSDLHISFDTLRGRVKAVGGAGFSLEPGEILGLAGESGCGKTTSALSILKLLPSNALIERGTILFNGEDLIKKSEDEMREVRWKEISIIFQGAMNALNPVATVRDQIVEAITAHESSSRSEAIERTNELLRLVEIQPERGRSYPHELSGGMKQRAMIAMSLACHPKLVIADEPTTALDVVVQAHTLNLLRRLQRELRISLIMISHDLSILAQNCDRIAIMYAGQVIENAPTKELVEHPAHPYTAELLRAIPELIGEKRVLKPIPGNPPDLLNPPSGCRYADRCPWREAICSSDAPALRNMTPERSVACHFPRSGGHG